MLMIFPCEPSPRIIFFCPDFLTIFVAVAAGLHSADTKTERALLFSKLFLYDFFLDVQICFYVHKFKF